MTTRRQTIKGLVVSMAAGVSGLATKLLSATTLQEEAKPASGQGTEIKRARLLEQALPEMEDKVVTMVTVEYPPGAGSDAHRHPGPVFGFILEGSISIQIEPGPIVTYQAGQVFYEPPLHVHRVSRNPSKTRPAKLLAFIITQKGQPLTVPVGFNVRVPTNSGKIS